MKKNFILICALLFVAASCNSLIFGGTGSSGVFKSTDSGHTFQESNKIDKKNSIANISVNSLAFDPTDTDILYLSSSSGIYRSQDAGATWKLFVTNILVADFAIDPFDTNIIYAVGSVDGHAKVIKTTDGGQSWRDKYTEPTTGILARTVALDPKNHLHIMTVLSSGELIESTDGGDTWQVVTKFEGHIISLRYAPNGKPYLMTSDAGLFASNDNGKSFTNISSVLTEISIGSDPTLSTVGQFLDYAFDVRQPNVIYLATDQGLVRSVNSGGNWMFMKMPVRNGLLRTSAIAVNPKDSNNLYAVIGDTMVISINGGITWETRPLPTGQEVHQLLIDPNSPNVMYMSLGVRK